MRQLFLGFFSAVLLFCLVGSTTTESNPEYTPVSADRGETVISLSIPSDLLSISPDNFDPTAYAIENGFVDAVLATDGTLTVTMTQRYYTQFCQTLLDSTTSSIETSAQEAGYRLVSCSDDLSQITLETDSSTWTADHNLTILTIQSMVRSCQALVSDNPQVCTITVLEETTGNQLAQQTTEP